MNIHFYLDNKEKTVITTLYDLESNPFKLNDIIHLGIKRLHPKDYNKYIDDFKNTMIKENDKLNKIFRLKSIKLVIEKKYLEFNVIDKPKITIEYHCKLIDK